MVEVKFLVEAAEKLRAAREPFLVATVMRVRGSSYRRPGARMLMTRDRWIEGSVSGGCLEKDVLQKAWWRTERGPALVTYDMRADEELRAGFGLGCDGVVDVLLERADAGGEGSKGGGRVDPLRVLAACMERQTRGAMATVFESREPAVPIGARVCVVERARGVAAEAMDAARATGAAPAMDVADPMAPAVRACLAEACAAVLARGTRAEVVGVAGTVTALVEPTRPPPRLFLFGAGHDAVPVARIAQMVAWEVFVCEPRARLSTRERFAFADAVLDGDPDCIMARLDGSDRAVAVVMGHDYERDRAWLGALLASRAVYIGMLGPRRRTERMRTELGLVLDERVFAPVGLALGAETPHEIALATIAEIEAVLAHAPATSLRDRSREQPAAAAAEWSVPTGAILLAAGGSARLGRPKQLVGFRGLPLVRAMAEQLLASRCRPVRVILGSHAEPVAEALEGLPVSVVINDGWREGLASSIRAGVALARMEGWSAAVLVLVDQPGLLARHVDRLIEAHEAGARAAAGRYGGGLGAPALFDASLFDALSALRGDRGAKSILAATPGVAAVDFPEGILDVDTERDVARLGRPI